jgi:hypothetical protein
MKKPPVVREAFDSKWYFYSSFEQSRIVFTVNKFNRHSL